MILLNSAQVNFIKDEITSIPIHVFKSIPNHLKTHVGKGKEKAKKHLEDITDECLYDIRIRRK